MTQVPPELQQRLNAVFFDGAARIERAARTLGEVAQQELAELDLAAGSERAQKALAEAAHAVAAAQKRIQGPRH